MKKIAVINFKGGVGKTTIAWLLGKYASQDQKKKVLLFDVDAQMSLTQALTLDNDAVSSIDTDFRYWQKNSQTISEVWQSFINGNRALVENFDVDYQKIIYSNLSDNLHFVPSVEGLYYHEIVRLVKPEVIRPSYEFVTQLVNKFEESTKQSNVKPYDYILFDCPPSLSILSLSVIHCVDMLLIPINPDFFAIKGLVLLLKDVLWELKEQEIFQREKFPLISVLMNKAKPGTKANTFTKETNRYFDDAKYRTDEFSKNYTFDVKCLNNFLSESVSVKRVFEEQITAEIKKQLEKIWNELA